MFVEAHATVPLKLRDAQAAIDEAIADGGLTAESQRAAGDDATFLLRVGPKGSRGPAKQVRVEVLPSHWVGTKVVVALRWEATGAAQRLFPSLDANLTLSALDPNQTWLSIVGSYRPPLDAVTAGIDRAVLSKAAERTLAALLAEIVAKIAQLAPPNSLHAAGS